MPFVTIELPLDAISTAVLCKRSVGLAASTGHMMGDDREAEVVADNPGATNDDFSAENGRENSEFGKIGSDGVEEEQSEALAAARSDARSELESLFFELYPGTDEEDGLKTSRNERLSKGYQSVTLTYGEVSAKGVRCLKTCEMH